MSGGKTYESTPYGTFRQMWKDNIKIYGRAITV
jgi:hypothetical protein